MAKIVGLKDVRTVQSKKTGKPLNSVMLWVVGPGQGVVGQEAIMQFVNAALFDGAVKGRSLESLVGRDCQLGYDHRGFLSSFSVQ